MAPALYKIKRVSVITKRGILVYTSTLRLLTSLGAGKWTASTYHLSSTTYLLTIYLIFYCNIRYASFLSYKQIKIVKIVNTYHREKDITSSAYNFWKSFIALSISLYILCKITTRAHTRHRKQISIRHFFTMAFIPISQNFIFYGKSMKSMAMTWGWPEEGQLLSEVLFKALTRLRTTAVVNRKREWILLVCNHGKAFDEMKELV